MSGTFSHLTLSYLHTPAPLAAPETALRVRGAQPGYLLQLVVELSVNVGA